MPDIKCMTKEEFIKNYCEKSRITWEELQAYNVVLPCKCGQKGCAGWAMVSNNPHSIKSHNELYA